MIYVPGLQFSKLVLSPKSVGSPGASETLCACWLALWRTSGAWELQSVTPPSSPGVLVCLCTTTLGGAWNNRKQVLMVMKPELSWIHGVVFKVGLQYRIACHGEAAAVRREGQSLHVAASTMLNMTGVTNRMAQTMLGCCIPSTMSISVATTWSAEPEWNCSRRKNLCELLHYSSYLFYYINNSYIPQFVVQIILNLFFT